MQAIFVAYDLAHHEKVIEALHALGCRGYTSFGTVQGRGTKTGEPHLGTHAWPSLASAMLTFVDDEKVNHVLSKLKDIDDAKPKLGLRAFVWPITQTI